MSATVTCIIYLFVLSFCLIPNSWYVICTFLHVLSSTVRYKSSAFLHCKSIFVSGVAAQIMNVSLFMLFYIFGYILCHCCLFLLFALQGIIKCTVFITLLNLHVKVLFKLCSYGKRSGLCIWNLPQPTGSSVESHIFFFRNSSLC